MLKIKHHEYGIEWALYSRRSREVPHCWGVSYAAGHCQLGSGPAFLSGEEIQPQNGKRRWSGRLFLLIDSAGAHRYGSENDHVLTLLEPGGQWL